MTSFLLDTVIPIGSIAKDFPNLEQIINSSRGLCNRIILVVDDPNVDSLTQASNLSKMSNDEAVQILQSREANPGGARNLGLISAESHWTHFCDSDDLPQQIEITNLLSNPQDAQFDLHIGSFATCNAESQLVTKHEFGRNEISNLLKMAKHPGIWRWVIRRDFIGDTRFPNLSMGEDQLFIIRLLSKNPRIKFSKEIIYIHVTGNSRSLVGSKKNIGDLKEVLAQVLQLKLKASKYCPIIFLMSLRMSISLIKYGSRKDKYAGFKLQLRLITKFIRIYSVVVPQKAFDSGKRDSE
jgi:glycosyltransferase involved in cell wall biosynthesis